MRAAEISRGKAASLYASGIAEILGLGARQRRTLVDAASHLGGSAHLTRIEDFQDVMRTVLYAHERWDGAGGFPGLAAGKDIPIESRVLSVADAWAALTCRGSRELDPLAALCLVRARAGGEFDPEVVAAAIRSVEQELLPITVFQRTAAARRLAPVPG